MRTVQSILDFFFETPQAYFCDRCGECHRAGECKSVETTQREPKAEEKRADESKEEAAPRKPKEKRKRRVHNRKEKKRKGSSRSLRARRGRDRVRRPGLKTGISGMMRTRLDEGGLSPPPNPRGPRSPWVMRWGLDLDLPLISPADADPAAVPRRRVRSDGRGRS
jgi:hypothetical protein